MCLPLKHRAGYQLTSRSQARTALAETPGSRFIQESEAALAEQRFGDLLNLLVPHFNILFEKTNGSGMFATNKMFAVPLLCLSLHYIRECPHISACFADLECCINVICHLIPRLPPHQIQTAAKQVASALTSSVSSIPCHLRLACLI